MEGRQLPSKSTRLLLFFCIIVKTREWLTHKFLIRFSMVQGAQMQVDVLAHPLAAPKQHTNETCSASWKSKILSKLLAELMSTSVVSSPTVPGLRCSPQQASRCESKSVAFPTAKVLGNKLRFHVHQLQLSLHCVKCQGISVQK